MLLIDLSPEQVSAFHKDGYVIIHDFCSPAEVAKLRKAATEDRAMQTNAMHLHDRAGRESKLSLWYTPGDDVFGYYVRSEKMINSVYQLLDSDAPVCLFHTKILQKDAWVGGAWEWHQDYGYWYKNQFMFPDQLISVMMALQPETRQNGCLQVIKGSHKLGRIDHDITGEQMGADLRMVNNALKTMELVYIELQPGDTLFFHSNLLHRSEANLSDEPRLSLTSCYSSLTNLAYNERSASWHTPIKVVPNEAILEWEGASLSEADFLKRENDPAFQEESWHKDVAALQR